MGMVEPSEEAHPKVTELIRAICEKCAGDALDLSLADLGSVFDGVDPAGNENEQKILEIVADLKPLARAAADRVPSAKPDHSPSPSRSPLAPYAARCSPAITAAGSAGWAVSTTFQ